MKLGGTFMDDFNQGENNSGLNNTQNDSQPNNQSQANPNPPYQQTDLNNQGNPYSQGQYIQQPNNQENNQENNQVNNQPNNQVNNQPSNQGQYQNPIYQQPQYTGQSDYQQNQQGYQQNQQGYQQNQQGYQQNQQGYQQQNQPNSYQQNQYQQYPPRRKKDNGLSIAALVCGIISVVGCCLPYFTVVVAIAGIVLGILSINKHKDDKNLAIIGIVLSAVGILIGILALIGLVAIFNSPDFWESFYEGMEYDYY
jgi:thiol:disulfide interchange protein